MTEGIFHINPADAPLQGDDLANFIATLDEFCTVLESFTK